MGTQKSDKRLKDNGEHRVPRELTLEDAEGKRAPDVAERAAAAHLVEAPRGSTMLALRSRLGLKRETFARLLPISTRSLASIERGQSPSETVARRLTEILRVVDALAEVVEEGVIGPWLLRPNDAFEGLKPIEVIERGQIDRIWQMIFLLRSGTPS